jgi:hypothetical protein
VYIPLYILDNNSVKTFPRQRRIVGGFVFYAVYFFPPRVDAGSNTSAVVLQIAGGDEEGTQSLAVKLGNPVPGGYKYGDLTLHVGGVSNLRQ